MKKLLKPFLIHFDSLIRFLYSRCPGVRNVLHALSKKTYSIDGNYVLNSFQDISAILAKHGISWKGAHMLELGPGSHRGLGYAFLAHGASHYIFADKFSRFDVQHEAAERAFIEKTFSTTVNTSNALSLLDGAENLSHVPDNSTDIILNVSVFEHVKNVPAAFAEMHRVLKPGGVAYCSIDPRDHYQFDHPYLFLKYSEYTYTHWLSAEGYSYTNRWQVDQHNAVIDSLSFERLWEATDHSDIPLPKKIHPTFAKKPGSVLTTSRIQYLLKKRA